MIHSRRVALLLISMVATFVIVRIGLYFRPNTDLNLGPYNIHHLFTGILLLTLCGIGLVLSSSKSWITDVATIGFGIGLSLALDEWVYLIVTDGSNASYLRPVSLTGGGLLVGLASLYVWFLSRLGKRLMLRDARRQVALGQATSISSSNTAPPNVRGETYQSPAPSEHSQGG